MTNQNPETQPCEASNQKFLLNRRQFLNACIGLHRVPKGSIGNGRSAKRPELELANRDLVKIAGNVERQ